MGIVQVRRVPDDLHRAMKERAEAEGLSLNDFLLDVIRREMALPSMAGWLDEVRETPVATKDFDMSDLIDGVRSEFEGSR